MSGGAIAPYSVVYPTGTGAGEASPTVYIPTTNTNNSGAFEGIGVTGSATLVADAPVVLQFLLPENIPSGQAKLRLLAMANAATGVAKVTVADGVTTAGSNIGATVLTNETQVSQTWTAADVFVENKVTLSSVMVSNAVLTCAVIFNAAGWSLAPTSVWVPSLIWE